VTEHLQGQAARIDPFGQPFADAFGAFLASSGALGQHAIDRAKRAAASTGGRFDATLMKLGMVSEQEMASALSRYLDLPRHRPGGLPEEPILAERLSPAFVEQNRVLPVALHDGTLTLAVVDPLDRMPLESIHLVVDHALRLEIMTAAEFEKAFAAMYGGNGLAHASARAGQPGDDVSEHDLARLREGASEGPVILLVDRIIANAVDAGTSDIYVEPSADALGVRYRIDGVLRRVDEIPAGLRSAAVSRIKILAKLDIAERRLPQDGRIKLTLRGSEIDFRVATMPTLDGETVTMRVFDQSRVELDFPTLGFNASQIEMLQLLMQQANGIVLVTGPTGSGKTTTLYTMLKQLNRPRAKLFTVEDPIEYQIPGISQVQVQDAIGLDFPACLRAILRHHPDMIMIGEIRDAVTAHIAVQASLTGHLVFSTVHTNSAAETVTRLVDMGIDPFLLGSTLRGIVAQRLVGRLCPDCAQPHQAAADWAERLAEDVSVLPDEAPPRLLQPSGCAKCHFSGFLGQLSIAELMIVDAAVRAAILQRRPGSEIEDLARARSGPSMYEDGIGKAKLGLTTVEEVLRVTNKL
jgi:general secretion pathway protein E